MPLEVYVGVFRSPYMCMRDAILMRRAKQYPLFKDGKSLIINAHKGKYKISLVSAKQAETLISSSRQFALVFWRQISKEMNQ